MNGKLLSINDFDPTCIILKAPPTNSNFSEIWYKYTDNGKVTAVKPVFKTPRLPIKYGAKRFSDQSAYGYCLNMSNKDIDPEIGEFYDFVKQMDKALIGAFTEGRRSWAVKPTVCLKYRTAMKRKTVNDDFFFQIKLIHTEKGANNVTVIYGNDRTKLKSEDITYGKYADQFICPAYLYYDSDGIHPIWQAHQIVLSTVEKVFLEHCILDHMGVPANVPARYLHPLHPYTYVPPVPAHTHTIAPVQMPSMSRLSINVGELKSVISGLRKCKEEFHNED
jgi:hypothetical protein